MVKVQYTFGISRESIHFIGIEQGNDVQVNYAFIHASIFLNNLFSKEHFFRLYVLYFQMFIFI